MTCNGKDDGAPSFVKQCKRDASSESNGLLEPSELEAGALARRAYLLDAKADFPPGRENRRQAGLASQSEGAIVIPE